MKVYKYDDKMVYDKDLINHEDGIFVKRVSSNNDRYFIYPFENPNAIPAAKLPVKGILVNMKEVP